MENEIGTIETGKFADLLLAYNNPLKDLKALLDVKMVIRNGEHIVENHEARARRKKIRFCPPDPTIITE